MFKYLLEMLMAHRHSREVWNPAGALLGRDRRIFQRIPVEIRCKLVNRSFGLESEATLINLSLGGAGLLAPVTWPEGGQIEVKLADGSFKAEALIVFRSESSKQFRYGIKFQNMGFFGVWQLRKILKGRYAGPLSV